MNAHKSLWLAIPLALMLPVGCNNAAQGPESEATAPAAEAPEGTTTETPAAAATSATAHHGRHHARSAVKMFFHAAKALDLDATQLSTIESLQTQLHADGATMRAPQQALHAALVAGVQAGNIDLEKLAPLQAAVQAAHTAHQAKEATALNGLWSALQPTQRAALVAAIRAKQAQRAEQHAERQAAQAEQAEGAGPAGRVAHLTTQLSLDTNQQASVAAITVKQEGTPATWQARHAQMQANREALLTAFAADTFDARTLNVSMHPQMGNGQGHAAFLAQLVPVLRADQRATLANSMQQHGG